MSPFKFESLTFAERVHLDTVVGKSYNVLKHGYVTPENVKIAYPILKANEIRTAMMPMITEKTNVITGNSLKEIAEEFSLSVSASASAMMFSASIAVDFKKETKSSTEMAYCKLWHLAIKKRESLANDDDYKKHLHPQFESDINNLTPEKFFEKYGTHLITEAWFGGRLEFNFSKEKQINETKEDIKTEVKAAYGKMASAKSASEIKKSTKDVFGSSDMTSQIVGGTSISVHSEESFVEEYKKWTASLAKSENLEFCALPSEGALVPLWELCKNPARARLLENYYKQIAASNGSMLAKAELYVKNIQFVNHSNATQAKRSCPDGYVLVDKDLNAGAKGDYIYMCYELGQGKSNSITNCLLDEASKAANPAHGIPWTIRGKRANYYRHSMDLNKGAKGQYIYFYHTKDTNFSPIKRMTVVFQDEKIAEEDWEVVRWGRTGQAGDCNKSVGGKYIYIYVNRG